MGMTQIVVEVTDEQRARFEEAARARGLQVDAWLAELGRLASERQSSPDVAEVERLRRKLAQAGLLWDAPRLKRQPPDPERVARARIAAGRGKRFPTSLARIGADRFRRLLGARQAVRRGAGQR